MQQPNAGSTSTSTTTTVTNNLLAFCRNQQILNQLNAMQQMTNISNNAQSPLQHSLQLASLRAQAQKSSTTPSTPIGSISSTALQALQSTSTAGLSPSARMLSAIQHANSGLHPNLTSIMARSNGVGFGLPTLSGAGPSFLASGLGLGCHGSHGERKSRRPRTAFTSQQRQVLKKMTVR